jgi:GH24 family phage-related lysozyme (muramidase)
MTARLLCVLLAVALAGCGQLPASAAPPSAMVEARAEVTQATSPVVTSVQEATATAVMPAVVALQEIVQHVTPPSVNAAPAASAISPAAVALIVRWEVGSASRYARRYQAPIWPGGASGVTWGIGYDGGHQTRQQIGLDWSAHDAASRLQATAGITGQAAQPLVRDLRDVTVPFGMASDVFALASLPRYRASARRAFGVERFDALPADAQGALVSLVYNRGTSMSGPTRAEMRAIRDTCLPRSDVHCVAGQIRQMCRLWRGTNLEAGLCGRREDEAGLTERAR